MSSDGFDGQRRVARQVRGGHRVAFACEVVQEGIPERRLAIALLQRRARAAAFGEPRDRLVALGAEQELDLAELVRLEAAGGLRAARES